MDRALAARMAVSLLVVVLLPVAFVYAVVSVPNAAMALVGDYRGPVLAAPSPVVVAGVVAVGLLGQYLVGPRLAMYMESATTVDPANYPRLDAAVRRSAQQYDVPEPDLAVVDNAAPNAFVVGRSSGGAVLTVTEGLLDTLDDDELEAVVAHELAHVKNRDVALMSVAFLLPTVTYVVAVATAKFLEVIGHAAHAFDDDDGLPVVALLIVGGVLTIAVSALFWVASFLLFRILSRYREYAADRAAAEATGDPTALASALHAIDDGMTEAPDRDLRAIDGGAESLFVVPVEAPNLESEDRTLLNADLFPETHPPTEERVERLQSLAGEAEAGR